MVLRSVTDGVLLSPLSSVQSADTLNAAYFSSSFFFSTPSTPLYSFLEVNFLLNSGSLAREKTINRPEWCHRISWLLPGEDGDAQRVKNAMVRLVVDVLFVGHGMGHVHLIN